MATDIDLEKEEPGKMFTVGDNAKDYTFFLVKPKGDLKPSHVESNPSCFKDDELIWKSPLKTDEGGKAMVDLKEFKAAIKGKLQEAKTPAVAIVLATARPGNENPNAKIAVFQPVTLHKKAQELKLNPIKVSSGAADWVYYHHSTLFVELVAKDIPQIQFEVSPKTPWFQSPVMVCGVWEQAEPGTNKVQKMLLGSVGEFPPPSHRAKCQFAAEHCSGQWWPVWNTQINTKHAPMTLKLSPGVSNYVFGLYPRFPGSYTLTVKGTGSFADQTATINLSNNGGPTGD